MSDPSNSLSNGKNRWKPRSNDIVDRLRAVEVNIPPSPGKQTIFEEAASEIVRLRETIGEMKC